MKVLVWYTYKGTRFIVKIVNVSSSVLNKEKDNSHQIKKGGWKHRTLKTNFRFVKHILSSLPRWTKNHPGTTFTDSGSPLDPNSKGQRHQ